jgi:phasin family protein
MSEPKDAKPKRPASAARPPVSAASAQTVPTPAKIPSAVVALPQLVPPRPRNPADEMIAFYRGAVEAVGESQRAFASGVNALALELAGMARTGITETGDSAAALAGARNFTEAMAIQFGFAQRGIAAMLAGSARLSEIGVRLATEATRPIVASLPAPRRAA